MVPRGSFESERSGLSSALTEDDERKDPHPLAAEAICSGRQVHLGSKTGRSASSCRRRSAASASKTRHHEWVGGRSARHRKTAHDRNLVRGFLAYNTRRFMNLLSGGYHVRDHSMPRRARRIEELLARLPMRSTMNLKSRTGLSSSSNDRSIPVTTRENLAKRNGQSQSCIGDGRGMMQDRRDGFAAGDRLRAACLSPYCREHRDQPD